MLKPAVEGSGVEAPEHILFGNPLLEFGVLGRGRELLSSLPPGEGWQVWFLFWFPGIWRGSGSELETLAGPGLSGGSQRKREGVLTLPLGHQEAISGVLTNVVT